MLCHLRRITYLDGGARRGTVSRMLYLQGLPCQASSCTSCIGFVFFLFFLLRIVVVIVLVVIVLVVIAVLRWELCCQRPP
jgi:hypothetical protein